MPGNQISDVHAGLITVTGIRSRLAFWTTCEIRFQVVQQLSVQVPAVIFWYLLVDRGCEEVYVVLPVSLVQ
ncbi:hypothetical protein AYI69_g6388 [Smittium culicis]|uniref:Uncharacterized protein n=1 Tax=Smittium culicis TaxID=133412 RepID=A0A1R1XZR6_9FUNG|nr:hypothetical protein AYI69_g6388 [Smittium culicis]